MMIHGIIVNSVAFPGGSNLFSMVDKNLAKPKLEQQNSAIEKLNKEQREYNTKRIKNQDWLNT